MNRRRGVLIVSVVAGALILSGIVWLFGSRNPVTPAGYVGYVTQGAVFGKTKFYGLQTGPTSPGRTWLLSVTNVSVTPYTYTEEFTGDDAVLSRDNLKISFRVHITWKVRGDDARQFVEKFSTLAADQSADQVVEVAYKNFLREPLRTYSRDELQKMKGLEIKDQITPTGDRILARVAELTKDTPFEVSNIVVGNIQYPEEVANAVALKLAATQVLERKLTEIEIEEKEREKRVVQAHGIAEAMEIINNRLTDRYLQHEAIDAQKTMVGGPNHTVIYVPVGNNGIPLVGAIDLSQGTTEESKEK